jgi:hypothetical protein
MIDQTVLKPYRTPEEASVQFISKWEMHGEPVADLVTLIRQDRLALLQEIIRRAEPQIQSVGAQVYGLRDELAQGLSEEQLYGHKLGRLGDGTILEEA